MLVSIFIILLVIQITQIQNSQIFTRLFVQPQKMILVL
jgi:hypothetical protein